MPDGVLDAKYGAYFSVRTKGKWRGETSRRLVDVVLILLALPILLIVAMLLAAGIKLSDPGEPVFYRARRVGRDGRTFEMLKFRTLSNDPGLVRCEWIVRQFDRSMNFKLKSDPRLSRLGVLLRRSHLDELPQLYNVLRGDMTLVGPRPNSRSLSEYEDWQLERLTVRPGVTGPWQLDGDRDVDYNERFANDIRYIRNRHGWADAMIVVRTLLFCLRGRGFV